MKALLVAVTGLAVAGIIGCEGTETVSTDRDEFSPAYAKPVPTAPDLSVVVLPKAGAGSAEARAINDAEEIAGASGGFATRWTRNGTAWIAQQLSNSPGHSADITESGTVVGTSGGDVTLWRRDGSVETVGAGRAVSVNEAETIIAGMSALGATVWAKNGGVWTAHALARLAGGSGSINEPSGLNEDGVIVGYSWDADSVQHAVKWVPSASTPGEWDAAVAIDAFAATHNTWASRIEGDDIVGGMWLCQSPDGSGPCTSREAWHWSLSGASSLGSLSTSDSWAEGLNASRYIVGVRFFQSRGKSTSRAFVRVPGTTGLRDLTQPKGFSDGWALDVNNTTGTRTTKQIVGYVTGGSGSSAALWILQ